MTRIRLTKKKATKARRPGAKRKKRDSARADTRQPARRKKPTRKNGATKKKGLLRHGTTSTTTTATEPTPEPKPEIRVRKDAKCLTEAEWNRLIAAMKKLKKNGWDYFTEHHEDHGPEVHGNNMFLPFHRQFILDFENHLREFDSRVTLPYWNWGDHPKIPKRMRREDWMNISKRAFRIPTKHKRKIKKILEHSNYTPMREELEDIHDNIHVRVGGDMRHAERSPNDPLFFLHHCYVDKVWSDWQCAHKQKAFSKPHPEKTMPHYYELKTKDVLDNENLGVRYR